MHYITVTVGLVEGHEAQGLDDAIAHGLKSLSEEVGGPVELVDMISTSFGKKVCVTIMAKPYIPAIKPVDITDIIGMKVPYGGVALCNRGLQGVE